MNDLYDYIEHTICEGERFDPIVLKHKTRRREIVFTRQLIMYFGKEFEVGSWHFIGGKFGLDHATAMHSYHTIEDLCATDKKIRDKVAKYRISLVRVEELKTEVDIFEEMAEPIRISMVELQSKYIYIQSLVSNIRTEIRDINKVRN